MNAAQSGCSPVVGDDRYIEFHLGKEGARFQMLEQPYWSLHPRRKGDRMVLDEMMTLCVIIND